MRSLQLSRAASISVFALGALVLLGWATGVRALIPPPAPFVTMKPGTALSFLLLGAGLRSLTGTARSEVVRRVTASLVIALAVATGLEYAFVFRDTASFVPRVRMSPGTALNFALLGTALSSWRHGEKARRLGRFAVAAAALSSFVAFTGYLFGAASLYRVGSFSTVSPYTAFGFLAACAAVFTADPTSGIASIAFSETTAGLLIRRLLPIMVLGPLAIGWLRLAGQRQRYYDTQFGLAVLTVADVVLLVSVLFAVASPLRRSDEERVDNERSRRRAEERLRLAIEASPTGMIITDRAGKMVLVNVQVERLFGYTRDELIGKAIELLVPPALRDRHTALREGFFVEPAARLMGAGRDLHGVRKDGVEVPLEIGLNPLQSDAELMLTSVVDVSERRRAEREHEELMEQRRATELLRERGRFFELSIDMVCIAGRDGYFEQVSPSFTKILGYPASELQSRPIADFVHPDDRDRTLHELSNLSAGRRTLDFANRFRRSDGTYRWLEWRAAREQNGSIYAVARDVTRDRELIAELRAKQASLGESLHEREVLLQEVHHRVKNNLQVVSSLINMQARRLADAGARAALAECKARVEAIASIHEELYQSKDFARVSFSQYVTRLVHDVFQAGEAPPGVSLEVRAEDTALPVARAIPCGLILNELVTNALKHAFSGRQKGVVRVDLRNTDDGIVLSVADDGIGIPPGFHPANSSSLGMHLVTMLSQQLSGRLEVLHERGTEFRLTVPTQERA